MGNKARDYESTVARMAGNIAAGMRPHELPADTDYLARKSVEIARAILAEVQRTAPAVTETEDR